MVFYAAFNNISVISHPQLTLFMSFLGFTVLDWGSEVSCPGTLPRKTQRIQCGSNQGPLDYESNTSPQSHAGPQHILNQKKKLPLCLSAVSVIKKKKLKMSNYRHIFGRTIMCPRKQILTRMKIFCRRNLQKAISMAIYGPVEFVCIFLNLSV